MSFTTDVKNELCSCELSKKQEKTFFYGFMYCLKKKEYFTESPAVKDIIKRICGDKITCKPHNRRGREGFLIDLRGIAINIDPKINDKYVDGRDENTGLFLRGAFISCGVVSDPNKEYHLEFYVGNREKCENICRLINESGMKIKISDRKGKCLAYTKDSEGISDILTYMGAMICSMEIMNAKIYKGVRNNVNRAVNCESANIDKVVAASRKQAAAIEVIERTKGLGFLTEDLRSIAEIRRDNIDLSLNDIGKMLNPSISRSGVYRRLKKIEEIAEELKK